MDKTEKANQRARDAIVSLLVAMEQPKSDDDRRTLTLSWENVGWTQLLKSMDYNIEHSPYSNSVLIQHLKEHAQWCIREAAHVKAGKQRELTHV